MDDTSTGGDAGRQAALPKSQASEDEQQSGPSGLRAAVRTIASIDCRIEGARGTVSGLVVAVSRTGALVQVLDADFATRTEQEQLMLYTARVWYHFEEGMVLSFVDRHLQTEADLVRVTNHGSSENGYNLIAIQFRSELTCWECSRLGIESAEDRPAKKPLAEEHLDKSRSAAGA